MPETTITIGGKNYKMNVEVGQEPRLKSVASKVDDFFMKVKESMPEASRDDITIMAGIMLADEFLTLEQQIDTERLSMVNFHNRLSEKLEKMIK